MKHHHRESDTEVLIHQPNPFRVSFIALLNAALRGSLSSQLGARQGIH